MMVVFKLVYAGFLPLLGSGGGAFTPLKLSPTLWVEANKGGLFQNNDGTIPTVSNGEVVGYLPDFSGNGNTYTSVTNGTTRPILQGVGTNPCIRFDGVNDLLMRTSSLGLYAAGSYTIALTIKGNSPAADSRLFAEGNTATNNTLFILAQSTTSVATSSSALYRNDAGVQLVNPTTVTNVNVFDGNPHVLIVTGDSSFVRTYVDGVAGSFTGWTPSGVFTLDRSAIGALLRASSGNWWSGDVYGIVAVTRVINANERAYLTSYMGKLAGLSL